MLPGGVVLGGAWGPLPRLPRWVRWDRVSPPPQVGDLGVPITDAVGWGSVLGGQAGRWDSRRGGRPGAGRSAGRVRACRAHRAPRWVVRCTRAAASLPSLPPRWPQLGGCGILGVGIWLAATQGNFATLSSSFPSLSAANLLIVTGAFVMAIGFVGCVGAIKENKCLLLTVSVPARSPPGPAPPSCVDPQDRSRSPPWPVAAP